MLGVGEHLERPGKVEEAHVLVHRNEHLDGLVHVGLSNRTHLEGLVAAVRARHWSWRVRSLKGVNRASHYSVLGRKKGSRMLGALLGTRRLFRRFVVSCVVN